jgi:nucleoid-associated protein YgaU
MTHETRIGLIVGLAIIVLFGVVLTEFGPSGEMPDGKDDRIAKGFYAWAPVTPPRVTPQPTAPTVPPTRGDSREMMIDKLPASRGLGQRADHSRVYVIRGGDNLVALARKFYRTPNRKAVMKIFNANRTVLQSPDSLGVGVKLVIPN